MNAKDAFSVALRVVGLFAFGRGFNDLLYFAVVFLGYKDTSVSADLPYSELILGLFYFSAGLYLIRGAPLVLDYAFPNDRTEAEPETELESEPEISDISENN